MAKTNRRSTPSASIGGLPQAPKWVPGKWVWNARKHYEWVTGHFERSARSQVSADALKLLYEKNTDQFKYYLTWRQLMFAGYFAVFSALALGFRWTIQNTPAYSFICPFLGVLVSFVFWALDYRNRQLYEIVAGASEGIEEALGNPLLGYFSAYAADSSTHKHKILKHGYILTFFYWGGGILLLLAGILVLFHPISIPVTPKGVVPSQ